MDANLPQFVPARPLSDVDRANRCHRRENLRVTSRFTWEEDQTLIEEVADRRCSHCSGWTLQARCIQWVSSLRSSDAATDTVLLGFPDPFAVATVGGEQTKTTSVIKKTLHPYWNESFDMYEAWSTYPRKRTNVCMQEGQRREHTHRPDF